MGLQLELKEMKEEHGFAGGLIVATSLASGAEPQRKESSTLHQLSFWLKGPRRKERGRNLLDKCIGVSGKASLTRSKSRQACSLHEHQRVSKQFDNAAE